MIPPVVLAAWLALAVPALPLVALADGGGPPLPEAPEDRFEELLARFDAAVLSAAADSTADEVAVLEAETIAWVAAELLEEGDPEIAADLLAEALALLDPSFSPPDSSER